MSSQLDEIRVDDGASLRKKHSIITTDTPSLHEPAIILVRSRVHFPATMSLVLCYPPGPRDSLARSHQTRERWR